LAGKNASLGEMIGGLASAASACPAASPPPRMRSASSSAERLGPRIEQRLAHLDPKDVTAPRACGAEIRSWIVKNPFPAAFRAGDTIIFSAT
jgi:pyruvate,water dikinase